MNSTEFNKIAGAGLGALLIFLLLNFFSGKIYGTGEFHGGEHVLAFALPVEEAGGGEAGEAPHVDLVALFSNPDLAVGEKDFRACSACHSLAAGENKVGPTLHNVVGRPVASVEGFGYSDAMAAHGGEWTAEELFHFLGDPKGWVPGTKMSFAGIEDPQERADVIAYLNQQGESPVDLTAGLPVAEANAGEATAGEATAGEATAGEATAGAAAGAAEGSVTEGENAGGEVTGQTVVEPSAEGATAPELPAAGTEEGGQAQGEGVLHSPDPSQEAPAQENPAMAGMPGEGSKPMEGQPDSGQPDSGQPDSGTPEQAAGATEPVPPSERVAGENAPPQAPSGEETSQGGAAPAGQDQEMAAAPAAPAEPAAGAAPAAGGIDFASADVAAGEKLFRRCGACHKIEEGKNGIGPSLWGVVGRPVASVEGFSYSDAMKGHGGAWTPASLFEYLENPRGAVPGTKMAFAGLKDPQDRIDVIAYLNEHGPSPQALK